MSSRAPDLLSGARRFAPGFAALGDETRLRLLSRLGEGPRLSITQLTEGSRLTRQAITKHLRVLERAGLVATVRSGRETRFGLQATPLSEMNAFLSAASRRWDHSLAKLKAFAESTP